MKITKFILAAAGVFMASALFQSCSNDDDNDTSKLYPNALVTVKPVTNESFYLQLDENTTLFPVNMTASPFGSKEVRALVNYEEVEKPSNGYSKAVQVNWMDSIRTKDMALNMGEENNEIYGKDPIEVVNDWVTIAEDGYLTLRFRTIWGDTQKPHVINLLASGNPENPYEIELRHNADGDTEGVWGDGIVAFKLDKVPSTEGKSVKLKLKWESFSGSKSVEFDYSTHVAYSPAKSTLADKR